MANEFPDRCVLEERVLERIKVMSKPILSGHSAYMLDVEIHDNLMRMRTEILAERIDTAEVTLYHPIGWWQTLKSSYSSWIPEWILDRYPVKYGKTTKTFDFYAAYPDFQPMPDQTVVYKAIEHFEK